MIVSDQRMPGMLGVELLARCRELYPLTRRVLLTAYSDIQAAVRAINEARLDHYLEKPWDNAQLLLVIQSAIERTQLFRSLRDKISELDNAHSSLKDVQSKLLRAFL